MCHDYQQSIPGHRYVVVIGSGTYKPLKICPLHASRGEPHPNLCVDKGDQIDPTWPVPSSFKAVRLPLALWSGNCPSNDSLVNVGLTGNMKAKTTELCDGNYHQNKTIQFWSSGMTSLLFIGSSRRYMLFLLRNTFTIENRLKDKVNGREIIEIHRK